MTDRGGLRRMAFLCAFLSLCAGEGQGGPPESIAPAFRPPSEFAHDLGAYRSPLKFDDGRPVRTAGEWAERRLEILKSWHALMGSRPAAIARPKVEAVKTERREGYSERQVRVEVAPDRTTGGYVLIPDGKGPFPAVLVVFYEPETAIGLGKPRLDFASRLARRGIAALAIGFDPRVIDTDKSGLKLQPLSYLAYVASNGYNALANMPDIDPKRVGIVGHSYGGKWAMFAACLDDRFACGVWSDPGAAFDEARPNVNYWDPWYLGWEPGKSRKRGPISEENPRTGAYKKLVADGHDLHELQALMAPRPFLVSGGSEDTVERWRALNHVVAVNALLGEKDRVALTLRPTHALTDESIEQIETFFEFVLKPAKPGR